MLTYYVMLFYLLNCKVCGPRGGDEHTNIGTSQYPINMQTGRTVLMLRGKNYL